MDKHIAEIVRLSLSDAHETFEATMNGVDDKVAHFQPGGRAQSVAASYIHAVVSEDMLLTMFVTKAKPLYDGGWAKKMGLNVPHPPMDQNWEKNYQEWVKKVKVDLPKFKEYAQAVYKQSDEYLATLTDRDLVDHKLDLSMMQLGEWPLGRFIIRFLISHIDQMCGEISAVKGVQNLKGYPF